MKRVITKVVCGIWIRSLTSLWRKRQEDSGICTEKKYAILLPMNLTLSLFPHIDFLFARQNGIFIIAD